MSRVILHCDGNGFFAAVECAMHPEYRDVPLAVCGDPKQRRGIVLAKNELAKQYGIQTGQTVGEAKRLCPALQITPPHHEAYAAMCQRLNQIYLSYTDLVEPFSVDESFLDVTASRRLFGDGVQIADQIRKRVKEELGITVSVGVSFNKVFAKMGSDYRKPDATTVISKENYQKMLYPLPVDRLLFVGQSTRVALAKLQIFTIGDLAQSSRSLLAGRLGKIGEQLHDYANGLDQTPVAPYGCHAEAKSVGKGMTFPHDLTSEAQVHPALQMLCERIGSKLRKEDYHCTQIALAIKDTNLRVVRRQTQIEQTQSTLALTEAALSLYRRMWKEGNPIRALTVTAGGFVYGGESVSQLSFWEEGDEKKKEKISRMEQTVDRIRHRFGWNSIEPVALMQTQELLPTEEEEELP